MRADIMTRTARVFVSAAVAAWVGFGAPVQAEDQQGTAGAAGQFDGVFDPLLGTADAAESGGGLYDNVLGYVPALKRANQADRGGDVFTDGPSDRAGG
jgi:hypothetical protein